MKTSETIAMELRDLAVEFSIQAQIAKHIANVLTGEEKPDPDGINVLLQALKDRQS